VPGPRWPRNRPRHVKHI